MGTRHTSKATSRELSVHDVGLESTGVVRALLEGFPGEVLVVDREGRLVLWSSREECRQPEAGRGEPLVNVLPSDQSWAAPALDCFREALRTGEPATFGPVSISQEEKAAPGREVSATRGLSSFHVRAVPIDETPWRCVLLVHDTRAVAVESRVRTKDQGLAVVREMVTLLGHEFRNPLSAIRSAVQVLAQRQSAGSRERLTCYQVAAHVDRLTSTLEDLMLLESPLVPEPTTVDVGDVVKSALRLVHEKLPDSADTIDVDAPSGLTVKGLDPLLAEQALFHLVSNAIEASRGQGRVRLRVECQAATLVLAVSDDGPGFPPDISRALEPFFTTKPAGSGLGLPTARKIVQAHGGALTVRNLPERGAEATLAFPIG